MSAPAESPRPARRKRRRSLIRPGIAVGAAFFLLFALARRSPALTESVYSRGIYPPLASALAHVSAPLPFSLAELVFAAIPVAMAGSAVRSWRRARRDERSRARSALSALAGAAAAAGWAWAAFLGLWGFQYARRGPAPLFEVSPAPKGDETRTLLEQIGARIDQIRTALPEDDRGVVRAPEDFRDLDRHIAELQREVLAEQALPLVRGGRAKRALASPLMLRWGVSGFYGPFTGEPNIVWPSPPAVLPFTIAHERAHLSGFAWEEDASFVGLLTTWRSPRAEVRYAGWFELWLHVGRGAKGRAPGFARDLAAVSEFLRAHRGRESGAVWATYSGYLKAHGVRGGVKNYRRAAALALGYLAERGLPPEPLGGQAR